jgi:hypothetical protein
VVASATPAPFDARQSAEAISTPLGPLQVRIGMHTGAPLAGPQDANDYIGHEVDYAKRVSALASGGQILLSETTAALVRGARIAGLALHRHGEQELKGIGRIPLFELLHGDKRPQPLDASAPARDEGRGTRNEGEDEPAELPTAALLDALVRRRIVGRDAELAELRRRVDAALQGMGATVFLSGEPGIGKTRLAMETATYARLQGFQVLTGRCDEEGTAPYQPFTEAVREYLNSAEPARLEEALPPPVACELVRIVPQIASKVKDVPQVPPLPAEQARQALIEAAQPFFAFIATQEAPLLLFLDDLHWADEGSLAMLHSPGGGAAGGAGGGVPVPARADPGGALRGAEPAAEGAAARAGGAGAGGGVCRKPGGAPGGAGPPLRAGAQRDGGGERCRLLPAGGGEGAKPLRQ